MLRYLLGGRPMKIVGYRFQDSITHKPVYLCQDAYGRMWLAGSAWSFFRVRWTGQ